VLTDVLSVSIFSRPY